MDMIKDYIKYNQENSDESKSLKIKIFNYFYYVLNIKNATNIITLYILHSIEIIQLISFAFSQPLISNWKISQKYSNTLQNVIEGFRLFPLLKFATFDTYVLVFYIIFAIIMVIFIGLILQILYFKENSRFFYITISITQILVPYLTTLLFLPLSEILIIPFICKNDKILNEAIECWKNKHLTLSVLGIIGELVLISFVYFLNSFYYYPFIVIRSSIRLNTDVDLFLIIVKFIYILQSQFITNQYISIFILFLTALYLVFLNLNKKIYICKYLELFVNLRNVIVSWTFFILLIARICLKSNFNNSIFLLLFSYPLVIYGFIVYYQREENNLNSISFGSDNINSYLSKIKLFIGLISNYIENHKTNSKYDENYNSKDEILLKGIIQIHTNYCLRENCPLTNFVKNEGNFNIQKQSLLNYMTTFFNEAIKKYPRDVLIRMYYIQFNYNQKYNLNNIKTTFEDLKKLKFGIHLQFTLYCQEKEISRMKLSESKDTNEEEKEKINIEYNYKTLKKLITNITKLYAEFWGIFANNITNNLNTDKVYKLGEKLNSNLKEINKLWKNNLRNKKINYENQNIAQLYSQFLKEILWDSKKSDLVQKKINEEQYMQGFDKIQEEQKINMNNIDNLESQDMIIYLSTMEKGICNIIQFSNSLSYILGYQKQELVDKPLDLIIPPILIDSYSKLIEEYINIRNNQKNTDNDNLFDSNKNSIFLLFKTKTGYIKPFNTKLNIYDDNDFSSSFLVKMKLEITDIKSMYAYYLFAKPDFTLDSFSSSAIHLGLSMDLIKKYVIKLNILIRKGNNKSLNLFEKYKRYENTEKIVTWVFPDIIYPKDDINKNKIKDKDIDELINISQKNKLYLEIFEINFTNNNDILGFVFKLFETKNQKKQNFELIKKDFTPNINRQVIFDLLNLNYIRTIIVEKKSGLRNLREKEDDNEINDGRYTKREIKTKNKRKSDVYKEKEVSSEDELVEIVITKEKMIELQTKNSTGIKSFINILPFYGNDISLVKHRPNKEKYFSGKAQEPLIKISLNNFVIRIEDRIRENPNFFKKIKNMKNHVKISINEDDNKNDENLINNKIKKDENKNNELIEDINKEISGSSLVSLSNIINANSLEIIKYIDFLIYIFVHIILIIEFILSYNFFSDHVTRYSYYINSYKILKDISYIKYYVTEGVLATELNEYMMVKNPNDKTYMESVQNNLKEYLSEINIITSEFDSPKIELSKEFNDYISNTILTIKTLNNGLPYIEYQPYTAAKTKLTNALYYISTTQNGIKLSDKYTSELMLNLLDSYFIVYQKIIFIMINDFNNNTKNSGTKNIIIFSVSFVVSIIYLLIFYKLMLKLDNDREKPLNLFLTIKNYIFEDLKNSSENFSNKLLNEVFGADEDEEESQQDFKMNIKPKDINIAKFKALTEYRINNNKGTSFFFYFIQLAIFYGIILFVLLFKYINTIFYYDNINKFIRLYNSTYFSEIYLVTTIDIMKQYFYDPKITNYGYTPETQIYNFIMGFQNISHYIAETIEVTSKTNCFLMDKYINFFSKYFYSNFSELIKSKDPTYIKHSSLGFKNVNLELNENLKFLYVSYFMDPKININNLNASDLINDKRWATISIVLFSFLKPFYSNLMEIIDKMFYDYDYGKQSTVVLIFIIMLIAVSLYFWIVWKKYEDEFIDSIEKSFDLINLIPEEIKNILVAKLNENN